MSANWLRFKNRLRALRRRTVRGLQATPYVSAFRLVQGLYGSADDFTDLLDENRARRSLAPSIESLTNDI